MFRQKRKTRLLFALTDILLATLAFEVAYRVRAGRDWHFLFYLTLQQQVLVLGFSAAAWVAAGSWRGVYERLDTAGPRRILADAARQFACGALCLLVFEYGLRMDLSRFFLILYCSLAGALVALFRLVSRPVRRRFAPAHYVMVVGTGERALRLAKMLEGCGAAGVRLRGFFGEEGSGSIAVGAHTCPVYPLGELPAVLREQVVDEIVIAHGGARLADLGEVFLHCDQEGVRTSLALDFFPHVNSTMSLALLGDTPMLAFTATPHDEVRLLVKRATDIAVAAAGLLLLAPLMAAVALLIRFTSPGPAIFHQTRCGLNGRPFRLYKFRSMVENAEDLKPAVAHLNTRGVAFKIPRDPRVTPLGYYLRKLSIDEWPQLWNVLRGDMSLVGPRPAVPDEVERYEVWQRRRLRMRLGLTCLWALCGRDGVDFETWMKLDAQYIDNWSLTLDWKILLGTLPRVLAGQGAS